MNRRFFSVLAASTSGVALLFGAAGGLPAGAASHPAASGGRTLVIDNSFSLVTADPGHMFENTGELVDNAMYDTLVTFDGNNFKKVVPLLATSWQVLDGGRKYVFHLDPKAKFSDGTPVTSADVVWSEQRLVNLKGNPSFLLGGETITAEGPETVVFTSAQPNPALPYILPNPSTGVLEKSVVTKHGGTDAADASTKDTAENWLNNHSAGSGPYVMSSFNVSSQVVLTANPNYWGPKPAWSQVVVRNVNAPEQGLDVERGTYEVGVDMSPSQTKSLSGVQVVGGASPNVFFLFTNDNPKVSKVTSNKDFQKAVRYAINYKGLLQLAGAGAVQSPGVIPTAYNGSLPASADSSYNLRLAKSWLAKSGLKHPAVTLSYPESFQSNGIDFGDLAARVQQDLQQAGITATLAPASLTVALQTYRAGTEQIGLWYWGPDFPEAADYLNFAPGALVGLRAGWTAKMDPGLVALAGRAASVVNPAARQAIFQTFQRDLNAQGPFVTLVQGAQVVVGTKNLHNLTPNGLWEVDLRNLY